MQVVFGYAFQNVCCIRGARGKKSAIFALKVCHSLNLLYQRYAEMYRLGIYLHNPSFKKTDFFVVCFILILYFTIFNNVVH